MGVRRLALGSADLSVVRLGVQSHLPVVRDPPPGAGYRLVEGMVGGRRKGRAGHVVIAPVVVEPVLARFEAGDHRVSRFPGVGRSVLSRRIVTAADVAALGATAQVEPPAPAASHSTQPFPLGSFVGSIG